ncbi:MAG: hypothetical protein ACREJN_21260 [Nitrospiraceae bacterium]
MDPIYDQISASTVADLKEDTVYDNFFVEAGLQRKMRASGVLDPYLGGTVMQEPFQFNRVNGGAHQPGADVNVIQNQILAAAAFAPKEYVEQVPLNLWQTNVINAGPAGRIKTADLYMTNAVQSLNTDLGIDLYRHGQPASGSNVVDNRQFFINGSSEVMNDGVTNSWDGNIFTTYGGQARNGAIGNVLNSIPIFCGSQSGGTGQISYKVLLEGYLNCVEAPDCGSTNKAAWAYLAERQEPKQRFTQETDMEIGVAGLKLLDAYIYVDKLCPSTKYGQILPSGLSQTTAVQPTPFTSGATPSAISNLPASTTIQPGEILMLFRMKGWKVRPVTDPEYNFNFTPPIRSQNNPDLIVMFLKAGINFYTPQPRNNVQFYGIGF